MTTLAGAWLPQASFDGSWEGALDLVGCLERCPAPASLECGVQCSRSLDVHRRGMPVYVPFAAPQLPGQYLGGVLHEQECSSSAVPTCFLPNPAAPTIMGFAERNP